MTRAHIDYWGDFITVPAIGAVIAAFIPVSGGRALALIAAGLVAWTLAEYLLHRFFMHQTAQGRRLHQPHHDHPYSTAAERSSTSTPMIILAVWLALRLMLSFEDVGAVLIGLLIGYFGFILIHHIDHRVAIGRTSLFYTARLRHARHHHCPDRNFGVTTSFWDIVFRTRS